jgi:hypothetical protein
MTTGDAHWASGAKVWFILIKDDKNRFPDNPLWGDGWGWALFKADAPAEWRKGIPVQSTLKETST